MKQKHFSWRTRFTITDEFEEVHYYVQGEIISLGRNLHILDYNNEEVAQVREKLTSVIDRYSITIGGQNMGTIKHKMSILKPKYEFTGPGWEIKGSTLQRDYTITKGNQLIGSAHKKLMSWGDSYEIEIEEHENETAVVAVILAINAILNDEKDEDINRFSDDD